MDPSNTKNQPSVSVLRREREREEITQRILDVARQMFVRDGYEAVTLRKIAKAIEYSPAAIYQYFKDKKALVAAIIQQDSQDLREDLLGCMNVEDPLERLSEMAQHYAAWGVAHPNHFRLMHVPPPALVEQEDELRRSNTGPVEQKLLYALHKTVKEAIETGLLKEEFSDPAVVAATLWAGIRGVTMAEITMTDHDRRLLGDAHMPFEKRLNTMKQVLRHGLAKTEPAHPDESR
ncbi:MAG: TetR/AcrR family transcriptional regulator [Candidatus Hydrogenedentota bacterium]